MKMTPDYLHRPVDSRMTKIIEREFQKLQSIVDIGCGSGLYGEYLKKKCDALIGFDYDHDLCENAKKTGFYDVVYCNDIRNVTENIKEVEGIFCSEVLEHMPNSDIQEIIGNLESICAERIVITVPNPLSPHSKHPEHILKYSIFSFLKLLNESNKFSYKLKAIGFSDYNLQKPILKALNIFSNKITLLSPTVLYVGERRN